MTTTYIRKITSELRAGDVVLCHGMRCLIDRSIGSAEREIGTVYFTDAKVLNVQEVRSRGLVPLSFIERPDGDERWTIQGNDLARWSVEATGQEV